MGKIMKHFFSLLNLSANLNFKTENSEFHNLSQIPQQKAWKPWESSAKVLRATPAAPNTGKKWDVLMS